MFQDFGFDACILIASVQPRQYIVIFRLPVYATIIVSLDSIYLSLVTLIVEALRYQAPHRIRPASEIQLRRHRVEVNR